MSIQVFVILRIGSSRELLFERLSGLEGLDVRRFDPVEDGPPSTLMAEPPDILVLDLGLEQATGLKLLELLDQLPLPVLIPLEGGPPAALHHEVSPALILISSDSSASDLAEALKRLPDQSPRASLQVGLAIHLRLSVRLEIRLENRSKVSLEIRDGDLWNAYLDGDYAKVLGPLLEQTGERLAARPLD